MDLAMKDPALKVRHLFRLGRHFCSPALTTSEQVVGAASGNTSSIGGPGSRRSSKRLLRGMEPASTAGCIAAELVRKERRRLSPAPSWPESRRRRRCRALERLWRRGGTFTVDHPGRGGPLRNRRREGCRAGLPPRLSTVSRRGNGRLRRPMIRRDRRRSASASRSRLRLPLHGSGR